MSSLIYDYETLHADINKAPIISIALCEFDLKRMLEEPYDYDDLVESADFYKFDVADQVLNYGRIVSKETVEWWSSQGDDAKKSIAPTNDDLKLPVLYDIMSQYMDRKYDSIFTRGNTFDPMITKSIIEVALGRVDPTPWWKVRDTRSYIDALTFNTSINNKFLPLDIKDKFIAHDPRHDIAADIIRIQFLLRTIHLD